MASETKGQTEKGYLDSLSKQNVSATAGFAAYEDPEGFKQFFNNSVVQGISTILFVALMLAVVKCYFACKSQDLDSNIETKATATESFERPSQS